MKKNNLKYLLLIVLFIVLTISLLGADSGIIVDRKAEWKYSDIGEIKEDWKSFLLEFCMEGTNSNVS